MTIVNQKDKKVLSINTNTAGSFVNRHLSNATNNLKVSLERLSTGYKINRAADNASNLAISKNMNCQISGTTVANENTQQAINLLDTADGALSEMTNIANRIRDLSLQSMNGTFSDEERANMQTEAENLTTELYRQRNSTYYNKIKLFGEDENPSAAADSGTNRNVETASSSTVQTAKSFTLPEAGCSKIVQLTEEEALNAGYMLIKTAEDLKAIPTNSTGSYILMNDIDLRGVDWVSKNFGGEFNGNGYTVKNLEYSSTTKYSGLFAQNAGTIKNLTLENLKIESNKVYSGGIAGANSGTIDNCKVSGVINCINNSGGIAGLLLAGGKITNCESSATVTGDSGIGGIVGNSNATITNCFSTGSINGKNAGGIVGYFSKGTVANCYATGNISGNNVGGLIGYSLNACTIKHSYATGNIISTGSDFAGGLVGNNSANVTDCYATGNVSGTGGFLAGLLGVNKGDVKKCFATGNINSTSAVSLIYQGGLIASNSGTVTSSYSKGTITTLNGITGGCIGYNTGTVSICSSVGNIISKSTENLGVGGFVGLNLGSVSESYTTTNVTSNGTRIGGFVGHNKNGNISDSYATGDIKAVNETGGFAGFHNGGTIENCYTTSNTTGNNNLTGGFVGVSNSLIANSFTSGKVSGNNGGGAFAAKQGGINSQNCYSNSDQAANINIVQNGVQANTSSWFKDSKNLYFLGAAYNYNLNPPDLINNPLPRNDNKIYFQVGANSDEGNLLELELGLSMNNFSSDISTVEKATQTLKKVDKFKKMISNKCASIGATRNRLDSILLSQDTKIENLSASHSTVVDTDFAAETTKLTKNQILQNVAASLLSQANQSPTIALQLLAA